MRLEKARLMLDGHVIGEVTGGSFTEDGRSATIQTEAPAYIVTSAECLIEGGAAKTFIDAIDSAFREDDAALEALRDAYAYPFCGLGGTWVASRCGATDDKWQVVQSPSGDESVRFIRRRALAIVLARDLAAGTKSIEDVEKES